MNANDIIEKCARVCDRMVTEHETLGFHAAADIYKNSALQIRALKSTRCLKGGDANEPASALSKTGLDKSSPGVKAGALPAETVSEAMVERFFRVFYDRTAYTNKHMRAAIRARSEQEGK